MGEVLLQRRRELAVKEETTKGTDASITYDGSDSTFLVWNSRFVTEFGIFERDIQRATLSKINSLVGQTPARIQFDLEVRRTGSTDSPDSWDPLLEACGFLQTINAATSVVYTPSSTQGDHKTYTMGLIIDGVALEIVGAMGNVVFAGQVGQSMFMRFDFVGVYNGATDEALNTITHEAGVPEVFQGVGLTLTVAGQTTPNKILSSVEIDMGNTVVARDSVRATRGILHYVVTDRNPRVTIDPEFELVADEAFYAHLDDETVTAALAFSLESGTIAFALPDLQIVNVSDDERNGIQVAGLELMAREDTVYSAGDNEFTLTLT